MQQKHVITHPDQAGRTRSRQNQNYPEKYFRVTILFSYELQLLCVWYYRSPPEIVYLKCYCEFIFFFNLLIINLTFYFIFVYFSYFRGSKNRGSMDPVHGPGPRRGSMDQGSMFCTFPKDREISMTFKYLKGLNYSILNRHLVANLFNIFSTAWK